MDFCIPTGAMGNVGAGMFARKMGLPIRTLIIGTNTNDIAHRTLSKGDFSKGDMHMTLSEAINIQVPYNFERFFHFLASEDSQQVKAWMQTMEVKSKVEFSPDQRASLAQGMGSRAIDDQSMLNTMRRCWEGHKYVVDPHTSVAITAGNLLSSDMQFS